jgi:prepilin-type N-terminal cleavage/methylation domain-containing protein
MRQRGTTLIEIMIAMLLASIVSAFILMITRAQLISYEQNDQVARMQQNERAGVAYVESLLRRSCGGISGGRVQKMVGTAKLLDCLTVTSGGTNGTDSVDLLFGTTPWTSLTQTSSSIPPAQGTDYDFSSTSPYVKVADATSFNKNDYVLVTDFKEALLMQISNITVTTSPQAQLSLGSTKPDTSGLTAGWSPAYVMKAVSYTIYVNTTANDTFQNMLMLDPDGIIGGTDHSDAQPVVENVVDFQVAMGVDGDADGVIKEVGKAAGDDEWYGNVNGELPLTVALWNKDATTTNPRWLRLSMIFQTGNKYPGGAPTLPLFEDRTTAVATPAGGTPRYRPVRITVAPRVWNLTN